MEQANLRAAKPDDLESITTLVAAAYAPARAELDDLPDVTAGFAEHLAQDIVFVAESGSDILGVIVVSPRDGALWIINLAVAPRAAGQGIGRRLMQLAETEAAQHKCTEMRLRTHAGMSGTLAFYRGLGWAETNRAGNVVTMQKLLAGAC